MTDDCVDSLASVVTIARQVLSGLPSPFRIAFARPIVCGSFRLVIVCDPLLARSSSVGILLFLLIRHHDIGVKACRATISAVSKPTEILRVIVCGLLDARGARNFLLRSRFDAFQVLVLELRES